MLSPLPTGTSVHKDKPSSLISSSISDCVCVYACVSTLVDWDMPRDFLPFLLFLLLPLALSQTWHFANVHCHLSRDIPG